MTDTRYLSNKLADLHMVIHGSGATKAELKWAACEVLAIAEQMRDRLKVAEPLTAAIEAIAHSVVAAEAGDQ